VLPAPEVEEAMVAEPDEALLPEGTAEEDWTAIREVAMAKVMALSARLLL